MSDKLTSLNLSGPIAASGEKFAKEAALEPHTKIGIEGNLPEGGGAGDATISITEHGETDRIAWSFGGWVKRVFKRGGTSAGVKGEIDFD